MTPEIKSRLAFSILPHDQQKAVAAWDELAQSEAAQKRLAEWSEQDQGNPALEQTRRDLLPLLLMVEKQFLQIVRQWPDVFWRGFATEPVEGWKEPVFTGLAQLKPRGGRAVRDNSHKERDYHYRVEPHDIGLEAELAGELTEDNCVRDFSYVAVGMAESFAQTEEILHANVLNTGEVYNPVIGGDEVPLFSHAHPRQGGVYSNMCELELNEASLEKALTLMRRMPARNQLRVLPHARKLVVPIQLEFAAHRLMEDTAVSGLFNEGYRVLDFLENPAAWFIITTIRGLTSLEWQPFKLDLRIEDGKLVLEGSQSYGIGYRNPRGCFASFPKEVT